MTLENQALHLEVERLQAENAGLRAELAGLETYANQVTAERIRLRLALLAIAEFEPEPGIDPRVQMAAFAKEKSREILGLATPGEGGGECQ